MELTKEQITRIAELSRIELEGEDLEKFFDQFSNILNFVNQIDSINTSGVKVTYEVTGLSNVFRGDEVKTDYFDKDLLLANTPILDGTKIIVPAVFGDKNDS